MVCEINPRKSREVLEFDKYLTSQGGSLLRAYEQDGQVSPTKIKELIDEIRFVADSVRDDPNSTNGDLDWTQEMQNEFIPALQNLPEKRDEEKLRKLRSFLI